MEAEDLNRFHKNKPTKEPVLKSRSNFNRDRKGRSESRS